MDFVWMWGAFLPKWKEMGVSVAHLPYSKTDIYSGSDDLEGAIFCPLLLNAAQAMTCCPVGTESWVRGVPWNTFELPRAWRMRRWFTKGKSCLTRLFSFSGEVTGYMEERRKFDFMFFVKLLTSSSQRIPTSERRTYRPVESALTWDENCLHGQTLRPDPWCPAGSGNKQSTSGTAAAWLLFNIFFKDLCIGPEYSPLTSLGMTPNQERHLAH